MVSDLFERVLHRLECWCRSLPGNVRLTRQARRSVAAALTLVVALVTRPALAGTTERVSVSSSGEEANAHCFSPSVSADGRYVAFASSAANLVPNDTNGTYDVFVHDRSTGTTERVSVSSAGQQGNGGSGGDSGVFPEAPSISGEGRYVAFRSAATNLVPDDTNSAWDVFVHDRLSGTTERINVSSSGQQANDDSYEASISADGRYIAYNSKASNLVLGDTNGYSDVFVRDRQTGTTQRVNVSSEGQQANAHSYRPSISGDGTYVAFASMASNLVSGDTNGKRDVFVHNRLTATTDRISVSSSGQQGDNHSGEGFPVISANGRYVAFYSKATNLVSGDTNGNADIFVRDLALGTTELASVGNDGQQASYIGSTICSISGDGQYVAFVSSNANLVPGSANGEGHIFVRDRSMLMTYRISISSAGQQGSDDSSRPALSYDGRYVVFSSYANNLVSGDTGRADVFVRDRLPPSIVTDVATLRVPERATADFWVTCDGQASQDVTVSVSRATGDGDICVTSNPNLIFPTSNPGLWQKVTLSALHDADAIIGSATIRCSAAGLPSTDVTALELDDEIGPPELISVSSTYERGNSDSYFPSISADGSYVAFWSGATNLVSNDTNNQCDAFLRDRFSGLTERVSISSTGEQGNGISYCPSVSDDGRYVAFWGGADNLVPSDTNGAYDVFVRDRQTGTTERISISSTGEQGNHSSDWSTISGDGRYVAFQSYASNLVPGDTNDKLDVFVHDRPTHITERISLSSQGVEGNGDSCSEYCSISFSFDGRYVAFDSIASNLVSDDTNGSWDVFIRDRMTGTTERVSVNSSGEEGSGTSWGASISADGRYIAFCSWAKDLVSSDTNGTSDVFVRDRVAGTTERVSVNSEGEEGNGWCGFWGASISGNGRYVAFISEATNLVCDDTNGRGDIFVHDRETGTTHRITVGPGGEEVEDGFWPYAISADGRYITFQNSASNLVPGDYADTDDIFLRSREIVPSHPITVSAGAHYNPGTHILAMTAVAFDAASGAYLISGAAGYVLNAAPPYGCSGPMNYNGSCWIGECNLSAAVPPPRNV